MWHPFFVSDSPLRMNPVVTISEARYFYSILFLVGSKQMLWLLLPWHCSSCNQGSEIPTKQQRDLRTQGLILQSLHLGVEKASYQRGPQVHVGPQQYRDTNWTQYICHWLSKKCMEVLLWAMELKLIYKHEIQNARQKPKKSFTPQMRSLHRRG